MVWGVAGPGTVVQLGLATSFLVDLRATSALISGTCQRKGMPQAVHTRHRPHPRHMCMCLYMCLCMRMCLHACRCSLRSVHAESM